MKKISVNISESFVRDTKRQENKSLEENFAETMLREIEIRRQKLKGIPKKPTTKKV
jgi:hypothetical protein